MDTNIRWEGQDSEAVIMIPGKIWIECRVPGVLFEWIKVLLTNTCATSLHMSNLLLNTVL